MNAGFDIGDFVYIIITVLFLIAGALGKKKKPVRQIPQNELPDEEDIPVSNENQNFKIEDLFKEYMQPEDNYIPEESTEEFYVAEESIENPPPESPSIEELYASSERESSDELNESFLNNRDSRTEDNSHYDMAAPSNLEVDISDEIKHSEGKEIISEGVTLELEEMVKNFNAREGFIYSEILNRKEF